MEAEDIKRLGIEAEKVVNHPKLLGVAPAAAWFWLRGIVLAMHNGGVISETAVRRLKPGTAPDRLVAAHLWRPVDGGWRMLSLSALIPHAPAPAPPKDPTARLSVLTFPVVGKSSVWALTAGQVELWKQAYPGLDVLDECRRALVWIEANHKKTETGMPRFLVSWLTTSNDRRRTQTAHPRAGRTGAPPPGKYEKVSDDE